MLKKFITTSSMLIFLTFGVLQVMSSPNLPFPEPETLNCMECCEREFGAAEVVSCLEYGDSGAFCTIRVGTTTWTHPYAIFCGPAE